MSKTDCRGGVNPPANDKTIVGAGSTRPKASHFFAYISKMKYINRWNIMRNTEKENIAEHTCQCAQIAHALCMINNKIFSGNINAEKVAVLALFHEVSEVITGDLATPVKYYNPEIKTAYKQIESIAQDKLLNMLPKELAGEYAKIVKADADSIEYRFVKAADKLCAYIKCLEELKAGNNEFLQAKNKIYSQLAANPLPEVKYFMGNFIESFNLTLDELN